MSKLFWAVCLLFLITSCDSVFDLKNTKEILGFAPPAGIRKTESWRKAAGNIGGDGEMYIGYEFDNDDAAQLIQDCLKNGLRRLPVDEKILTDGTIFRYVDRNDSSGYYNYTRDNDGSYSIGIVDLRRHKIHIYVSLI